MQGRGYEELSVKLHPRNMRNGTKIRRQRSEIQWDGGLFGFLDFCKKKNI